MRTEDESPMLRLLRDARVEIEDAAGGSAASPARRPDFAAHRVETSRRLDELRRELGHAFVDARIAEVRASIVGRGRRIRDLEARIRRVEQHLGLASPPSSR